MNRFGAPLLATVAALLLLLANTPPAAAPAHDARLSHLLGMAVEDPNAEKLGTIKDFVLDASSARLEYAIIGSGGVLGLGVQQHALPASALSLATILRGILSSGMTKEQWRRTPPFHGNVATLPALPPRSRPGSALAQVPSPTGRQTDRPPPTTNRLELASQLLGTTVVGRGHQHLGTVSDLLVDLDRQKPALVLLRTAQVHHRPETFAIPLRLLTRLGTDKLQLGTSLQALEHAPVLTQPAWNAAAGQGVASNTIYRLSRSPESESEVTHLNQNI